MPLRKQQGWQRRDEAAGRPARHAGQVSDFDDFAADDGLTGNGSQFDFNGPVEFKESLRDAEIEAPA